MKATPERIDEPTRRLFLAALEAEAYNFTGYAAALRELLRIRQAALALINPKSPTP